MLPRSPAAIGSTPHRFRQHPMLGTVVEVCVGGDVDAQSAATVNQVVVDTIARRVRAFSVFDPDSGLER